MNEMFRAIALREFEENLKLSDELDRARALISWIDGACVDEEPHMVIREAINRYHARAALNHWQEEGKP